MTEGEQKAANLVIWERGQEALARILKYVKVEKVEALAAKIEDKEFRESMTYKMFIKSLN